MNTAFLSLEDEASYQGLHCLSKYYESIIKYYCKWFMKMVGLQINGLDEITSLLLCALNFNLFNHQAYHYNSLFGLMFYVPANSYGHVEMVSSPNHNFPWQA